MDHEIYLWLVGIDQKMEEIEKALKESEDKFIFLYEVMQEKGLIPKDKIVQKDQQMEAAK